VKDRKIVDYIAAVVSDTAWSYSDCYVQDYIKRGYQPYGNTFRERTSIMQPMVKYEDEKP
jgi:hypothetical protein